MSEPPAGATELLAAYDAQLRGEPEMVGTLHWHRHGPLVRGVFGEDGFTSGRLDGLSGEQVDTLVADTVAWFRDETEVRSFEWKTRGHDPLDVTGSLLAHGFEAEEVETVMIGRAALLAVPVALPDGVVVRRAGEGGDLRDDVRRASETSNVVFGGGSGRDWADQAARMAAEPDVVGMWLAEAPDGTVVCSGRLERVVGTEFAGLWGGGTLAEWRGRGIYRALVAARAATAVDWGATYLHSDCTAMSRPILERSGLEPVTTTTPYTWTRT